MVVIGTLSWNVNVEGAAEAKQQAEQTASGMDETAGSAQSASDSLGNLGAIYAGLNSLLSRNKKAQDESGTSAGFLTSSLFFLGSMVTKLILKFTGLTSALYALKKVFLIVAAGAKAIAGLPLLTWAATLGGLIKGALIGGFAKLVSVGGTLLAWGKGLIAWFAAGSAGALAAAAAIGAFIGLLGVFVLEITGVLDVVRNFAGWLRNKLPGWARDGLIALISIFAGPLAVIGGLIVGFVEGFLRGGLREGLRQAVESAREILHIFGGAWTRLFERIISLGTGFLGWLRTLIFDTIPGIFAAGLEELVSRVTGGLGTLRTKWSNATEFITGTLSDWKDSALGFISDVLSGFQDLPGDIRDALNDLPDMVSGLLKSGFNAAVPSSVSIPSVTLSAPSWAGGMSKTIGGGSLSLPQLHQGGMVEETGIAEVKAGETFIPADLRRTAKGEDNGGGDGGGTTIVVDVGGIEIGDQSMDISDLTRMELRELAEEIAEQLGTEVDTLV